MKKINSLVLSTLTAALLVGCGGGGSSSSSSGTTTPTDVTVERGPLWGASVTDAKGTPATQKAGDSNIYTFNSAPTYPIKAVGGIIDIDGDSSTTDDIFDFTGKELISYTNVITPITNYLGDITSEAGKAKLAKLESLGLIKDDLVNTVASKSPTKKAEMISLTNALFELMNDSDTNNDDLTNETNYNSFKNRFDTFVNMVKDDVAINAAASSQALEETILKGVLNNYTEAEGKSRIEEIKASLFTLTSEMLSGKKYKLNPNDDDSYVEFTLNADKTSSEIGYFANGNVEYKSASTWTIVNNKLQITLSDNSVDIYTFATTPANGIKVTVKVSDETESFDAVIEEFTNISSETTTPTTTSFVSGKSITASLGDVSFTANFYTDGSYSDVTPGDTPCEGTWHDIGNNIIETDSACGATFSFPSSNLSVGVNFTLDGDNSAPESATITSVSSINSGSTTTPTEPIPTTTSVSGKTIISADPSFITLTSTFNPDGTYMESYLGGTCTGMWKDFGSNKIGVTCEDAGTTTIPDSVASQTTNILQFNSTLIVGEDLFVTEPGSSAYSMKITAISDIAK